jgi:hypothetical protein
VASPWNLEDTDNTIFPSKKNRVALFDERHCSKLQGRSFIILATVLSGCSGDKAEQLIDTAKLEELQDNREHTTKLYQEIIERYPQTSFIHTHDLLDKRFIKRVGMFE